MIIYAHAQEGDDGNRGTIDSPVRSLRVALERARAENAQAIRLMTGSVWRGEGITGVMSGQVRHPWRWESWGTGPRPRIEAADGVRPVDIGARGPHDWQIHGIAVGVVPGHHQSDLIRVNGGADQGVADMARVTLRGLDITGNYAARVGLNIQGVVGVRVVGCRVGDIYYGDRSQGCYIGGCSDIQIVGCIVERCGWRPQDPDTASPQNHAFYIRTLPGLPIDGCRIVGTKVVDASSWGIAISTDSASDPVRRVAVDSCAILGGGKGILLGASEPESHIEPSISRIVFDRVGHSHDGSAGILALIEGAEDAWVHDLYEWRAEPGRRQVLHSGELGKPPSTGEYEPPVPVPGPLEWQVPAGAIVREAEAQIR